MIKRSFDKIKIIGRKIKEKETKKCGKCRKCRKESSGTKREDQKKKISKVVPRPQTDSDDIYDIDFNYRWGMGDPVVLPRAEIVEIVEEEIEEPVEEAFHGFEREEVEEALELQALIRENNAQRLADDNNAERVVEVELEPEVEVSPIRRENLSPRERKKRKATARAR